MQLDPTLAALVVTNVVGPAITWAITRRRNNADAAESLERVVAGLSERLNGMYTRLAASESRASAAESRLAASEARNAVWEAEVARLRGEVAGLRVEVEQHSANEKRLLEQLAAEPERKPV